MSKASKQIHHEYCALMVQKASEPKRNLTVKVAESNRIPGIRTLGLSKATLALQLSALF